MKFKAICFEKSHAWYGWLIRKLTRCNYNHVYIQYESEDWKTDPKDISLWDLDITPRGVMPILSQERDGDIVRYVPASEETRSSLTRAMITYRWRLGNAYDWVGLFSGLIRLLVWRVTGKNLFKSIHSKGRMFCSEMVSTIIKEAIGWNTTPSETSPADVLEFVTDSKLFK
jgi:hypothetical protein